MIIQLIVIGFGGYLVSNNKLALGGLTAFIVVANMLSNPISSIINVATTFQDSIASFRSC